MRCVLVLCNVKLKNYHHRSFPALFGARGKRWCVQGPSNHFTPVKEIEVTFYLLPKIVERTPKGSEEVFHLQAGLGRRSTLMPENYTHDEVRQHFFLVI